MNCVKFEFSGHENCRGSPKNGRNKYKGNNDGMGGIPITFRGIEYLSMWSNKCPLSSHSELKLSLLREGIGMFLKKDKNCVP